MASAFALAVQAQTPTQTRDTRATPPPPPGTGVIAGVLSIADAGRPARQARVSVSGGEPRTSKSVTTDDQGRFEFKDLPAGAFTLTASKPGFLDVTFGQRRPGSGRAGTPIQLAAGQKLERIALQIPRGGVITGTVFDSFGDPMFNTQVRAMRYVMRNGVRTLQQAGSGSTDDRGIYRIPALLPGDYIVSAMPRDIQAMAEVEAVKMKMELAAMAEQLAARVQSTEVMRADMEKAMAVQAALDRTEVTSGYTQTFHPGTLQLASATTVTLDISEEKTAIDLRLQMVPFASVSGSIASSTPLPKNVQVQMVELGQPIPGFNVRSTRVTPDGRFSFTGVPPGQYQITARATVPLEGGEAPTETLERARAALAAAGQAAKPALAPSSETLWAMTDLNVNGGNIADVSLTLQKGMSVSGTVAFDGGNMATLDFTRMRVTLAPAPDAAAPSFGEMPIPEAEVDANGRFTLRGVIPGKYRVVPSRGFPPSFTIESSVFAGRDVLDIPLEVRAGEDQAGGVLTFGTAQTDLNGTLRDAAGTPVADYTLIVFAADQRTWLPGSRRIQSVRPATDGRFSFKGLPPGDYRLAAVVDVEQGQWFDPAFLREINATSVAVALGKGEKRTQDLNVAK